MGLTLMARLASNASAAIVDNATRRHYVDTAARMQLNFGRYLRDPTDGLSAHGAWAGPPGKNNVQRSCCKWGRANGWGAMSRVEVLSALESFPGHPLREDVRAEFNDFIDAMLNVQDATTGRWHQVVNETGTYLETSVTAMMATALARGASAGWLRPRAKYVAAAKHAWAGVASVIAANGTVSGVCMGTGIEPNVAGYEARGTDFWQSAPGGVGAVLLAAAAVEKLM